MNDEDMEYQEYCNDFDDEEANEYQPPSIKKYNSESQTGAQYRKDAGLSVNRVISNKSIEDDEPEIPKRRNSREIVKEHAKMPSKKTIQTERASQVPRSRERDLSGDRQSRGSTRAEAKKKPNLALDAAEKHAETAERFRSQSRHHTPTNKPLTSVNSVDRIRRGNSMARKTFGEENEGTFQAELKRIQQEDYHREEHQDLNVRELRKEMSYFQSLIKKLNDKLSNLVEKQEANLSRVQLPPAKKPQARPPLPGKPPARESVQNIDKILHLRKEENARLEQRMAMLGDPLYSSNVESEIIRLKKEIEDMKKLSKQLDRQAKKNDNVTAKQPTSMEENDEFVKKFQQLSADLGVYLDKNGKLETKLDQLENAQQEQQREIDDLKEKSEKIETLKEYYGVEEKEGGDEKVKVDQLKGKKATMEKNVASLDRRCDQEVSKIQKDTTNLAAKCVEVERELAVLEHKTNGQVKKIKEAFPNLNLDQFLGRAVEQKKQPEKKIEEKPTTTPIKAPSENVDVPPPQQKPVEEKPTVALEVPEIKVERKVSSQSSDNNPENALSLKTTHSEVQSEVVKTPRDTPVVVIVPPVVQKFEAPFTVKAPVVEQKEQKPSEIQLPPPSARARKEEVLTLNWDQEKTKENSELTLNSNPISARVEEKPIMNEQTNLGNLPSRRRMIQPPPEEPTIQKPIIENPIVEKPIPPRRPPSTTNQAPAPAPAPVGPRILKNEVVEINFDAIPTLDVGKTEEPLMPSKANKQFVDPFGDDLQIPKKVEVVPDKPTRKFRDPFEVENAINLDEPLTGDGPKGLNMGGAKQNKVKKESDFAKKAENDDFFADFD